MQLGSVTSQFFHGLITSPAVTAIRTTVETVSAKASAAVGALFPHASSVVHVGTTPFLDFARVATPLATPLDSPQMEHWLRIAPSLPPSWSLVVGGLLYAEPMTRSVFGLIRKAGSLLGAFRPSDLPPPATPQTILSKVNQWTGRFERSVGTPRDAGALAMGVVTGAQILFGDETLSAHVPEAIALGISTWNYVDRTRRVEKRVLERQIASGERLTPKGWRAQEARALGILAPDVPSHFPPEHLFGSSIPRYSEGTKPGFSRWRNVRGLWMTVNLLFGVMRRSHSYREGLRNTFLSWFQSVRPGRHAPVSPKYLEAVDVMLPQWVMRMCEIYGVSLKFENMEKFKEIPEGSPVVLVGIPHSSIFPDFKFWFAIPRARFVADKKNFHDHPIIRAIGLAWFLDVIGLPFVERVKRKPNGNGSNSSPTASLPPSSPTSATPSSLPPLSLNSFPPVSIGPRDKSALYAQTTDNMVKYGIMPVFFCQGGRVPRAYRDDRSLGRPGLYSNVLNLEKPERYYNLQGTVNTAIAAARQTGKDAYIPLLLIDGAGRVMPKIAKNPPFIQPVQAGEITFSIGPVLRVNAISQTDDVIRRLIAAAKESLEINEFLNKEVNRWAENLGQEEAGAAFAAAADQDEIYYIIADRIRSVHPNFPKRNEFKRRLLEISVTPDQQALMQLLIEVSTLVKETEYQ